MLINYYLLYTSVVYATVIFQCLDAVGWWDAGMVMCMGQGADLHMAQRMPLPLTISCFGKSRTVLPFWCQLTRVVLNKIQEGRKMVVCVP